MGIIIGIDETGRGTVAGPLVVAAVVLEDGQRIVGVKDSKQLSNKQRVKLLPAIHQEALHWVLTRSSSRQIDDHTLPTCWRSCAVACAQRCLERFPDATVIIDGTERLPHPIPASIQRAIPKADITEPAVSAASVLAKVYRDDYMVELVELYPNYHFEQHKGYYTEVHKKALAEYGPCPQHRYSTRPVKMARRRLRVR